VHLEEDVARHRQRTNEAGEEYSLIDPNRAGIALMEIVSEPDVRSAAEARAYLVKLRQILRYVGSSRANMEEGNMRCEPNVSLRPVGHPEFGSKVELKNINSFRAVYLGIEYEVERQREILDSGGTVLQETRGWREDQGKTVSQRTKEFAHDYRYFPEPDLPPLTLSREYVEGLRAALPELPDARRRRFMEQYGLGAYEAGLLTESRARADYFEAAAAGDGDGAASKRAKAVCNWMLGDFARLLNAEGLDISDTKVAPSDLHAMIVLVEDGTISGAAAKSVFEEMFRTGKAPGAIVEEQGLTQISAGDELTGAIDRVIAANEKPAADFLAGKEEALKFLVGQVMKETRGRANPKLVPDLLRERLAAK
jgi:aspartyl-tRNA(Asn)/glutamyl-tRNA(Gln) amidotransferase subunit B